MAIVGTTKDTGQNDTPGAGPQATNSVAFQNNTLYLLSVTYRGATADTLAVSGGGLTWTKKAGSATRELWEGFASSGATTGTLSLSWTGTATSIAWVTDEFTGVDTTTRIVQTPAVASGTGTTGTGTTMAAFGDAVNNAAFAFFTHATNETSTVEGGYTGLANFSAATTPAIGMLTEYKVGEDTIPTATWTTSSAWHGIVCEIKAAAAGGNATATPSTVAAVGAVPGPTVLGSAITTPAVVAGIGTVPAPNVMGDAITTPAAVAAVGAVPAPAILTGGDVAVAATTVAGIGLVPAPTVKAAAIAAPAVVAGIGLVPAPTVRGGSIATPATVVGTAAVPAAAARGAAIATPATVAGIGTVPAPSILAAFFAVEQWAQAILGDQSAQLVTSDLASQASGPS